MYQLRKANERGHFDYGWLKTYHTFSFGDYQNKNYHHFRALRVINQDIIQPNKGFALHAHKNMEILTYVIEGAIAHQDNLGNKTVIHAGEIQRMTAGSGVEHSEYNASDQEIVELLQIWILPQQQQLIPSYQQKKISPHFNALTLIASPTPTPEAVTIHQDIKLWVGKFNAAQSYYSSLIPTRCYWLQLISGELSVNDQPMHAGDGLAISNATTVNLLAKTDCHFLWFDLN